MASAQGESFKTVPETCPVVDGHIEEFLEHMEASLEEHKIEMRNLLRSTVDDIKNRTTYRLREALTNAIGERNEVQEDCDDLNSDNEELEAELAKLRTENEQLHDRIIELESAAAEREKEFQFAMQMSVAA